MGKSQHTSEAFAPLTRPLSVNRETGVVTGLCVLGPESKNGGRYPEQVIDRAKRLYDGLSLFVDNGAHQSNIPGERAVGDKIGVLVNPRLEGGKLFCDAQTNPKHPFSEAFYWAAENQPSLYGLSHRATVIWNVDRTGSKTAESISFVYGVDIVGTPATTSSIAESAKGNTMDNPVDPRAIATTITTADALTQFLTQLLDALPSGAFPTPDAKVTVVQGLLDKMSPATDGGDAAQQLDDTQVAASLRLPRFGRVGKFAADKLQAYAAESKKKADRTKAAEMCKAAQLPEHLQTETFLDQVAESVGNEARAKALIEDRKAIGRPTAESGRTGGNPPRTTQPAGDAGGTSKSAKDLLATFPG